MGAKAAEDFEALAALRIGNHKQAEAKRLETEREKIRAQEQVKAEEAVRAKALQVEQATQAAIADARKTDALPEPLLIDLSAVATHVRDEATAAIDASQVISAAKSATAPADTGETMTLGQINTLIAPLKVDAAGLAELGFEAKTIKAAKHYPASDVLRILTALVKHLRSCIPA